MELFFFFLFLLCLEDKCVSSITYNLVDQWPTAEVGLYTTAFFSVKYYAGFGPWKQFRERLVHQWWQRSEEKRKTSWATRWRAEEEIGGNEELWKRSSCRERDELRGGNPSGGHRVLSDRLGLCNRMCVCVCVCWTWMCAWPPVSSQMCLQLLLFISEQSSGGREWSTFMLQFLCFPSYFLETFLRNVSLDLSVDCWDVSKKGRHTLLQREMKKVWVAAVPICHIWQPWRIQMKDFCLSRNMKFHFPPHYIFTLYYTLQVFLFPSQWKSVFSPSKIFAKFFWPTSENSGSWKMICLHLWTSFWVYWLCREMTH